MKKTSLALALALSFSHTLTAADFTIEDGETVNTTQALSDEGDKGRIEEGGTIATLSTAVEMQSSDQTLKNHGEISTTGIGSYGVFANGADTYIKNSGEMSTTGLFSSAIFSTRADAHIKNSGNITTTGDSSSGIESTGTDAYIKNSGKISTTGDLAYGIRSTGADAQIINSGKITTEGLNADGILSTGTDVSIINSGTIKSDSGFAISFGGLNPTLTLKRGSNLQGVIDVTDSLNLNVNKGLNFDLTLDSGSFNDIDIDDPFVIDGLRLVTTDRTAFAMQADFLADLSDTILGGLYHGRSGNPCCIDPCSQGVWVAGVGSYRNRLGHDEIVGYRNEQAGILFGYDTSLCSGNAGIFGAVMFGNPEISRHTQHADTKSYVGGLTYSNECCGTCYGLSVAGGYVDWENRRHVMNNLVADGEETAKACLDGTFITAEASLIEQICCLPCSPTMSFTLRYAGLYFGDYSEKGVAAPLSVEDRNIDLFTTRVEFAFTENCYNAFCLCIEPYFGFYGRYQARGNKVDAELLDFSVSFDQGGARNLAAILFGIRATKSWNERTLFMNLETDFDNRRSSRFIGEAGLRF